MDEDLYWFRNYWPNDDMSTPVEDDPLVQRDAVILFVAEAIEYFLRKRNIRGWVPEVDLQELRANNTEKRYFNDTIGQSINLRTAEWKSFQLATDNGFDLDSWLESDHASSENYVAIYLDEIRRDTWQPADRIILMLSFACTICRHAVAKGRNHLVNAVLRALVRLFMERYPYVWIYRNADFWAYAFIFLAQQDERADPKAYLHGG
ncbi:uncharacterized protein CDAR_49731 [Caerostris darwini]|uniref:Uncharacterized protein n=1 Tax=Caerostris darwini TaxID=1538125 RepID=A0AAV4W2Q2_9ARAC|nr:uncharacterized protein CDAR_49731 [Caerostris darwini]